MKLEPKPAAALELEVRPISRSEPEAGLHLRFDRRKNETDSELLQDK